MPTDGRVLDLEAAIGEVFAVDGVSLRGRGKVVVFSGQYLLEPEQVYEAIVDDFRALGFVPLLRNEDGRDVLVAYPAPDDARSGRRWVNLALFVATVFSVLMAGTWQSLPPSIVIESVPELVRVMVDNWALGLPFAVALLGILGIHELGHYFVARHYGLNVTLPYFIPFPLNPLTGTLGAVIRISSPFKSRKALFDVGIAGPLAGLALAVPVVAMGLAQAELVAVPTGPDASITVFNEPLLFQWMALLVRGPRAAGVDFAMNPLLMAGWWGFFITALNLLPVSQLDGGHISYALFGDYHRYVAWGMFLLAGAVALMANPGYMLMLGLVFMMGIEHPPALNDLTQLGLWRRVLGLLALGLFFLLITPDPFSL
jgi:membrane-associated protease RseP (regulator of RpoE activity)